MKNIKLFVYSGDGLSEENLELSDLIQHLNLILEKQDIHIYLAKEEYFRKESSDAFNNHEIERQIEESDIAMVILAQNFGTIKPTDVDRLYERICDVNLKPHKLYVYFRKDDNINDELKRFRDSFPEKYGHFTSIFTDSNSLKNDFMLQFQLFQSENLNQSCNIEIKDSTITMNGKDLYIDMQKVPFMGNNTEYLNLLSNINKTQKLLNLTPKEDKEYEEYKIELEDLLKKKSVLEKSLWETALEITRLNGKKSSERLKRAIELFNKGDNKGADAILNEEDIYQDADRNLNLAKLGQESLKSLEINLDELRLKVKTLENEMTEDWVEKVLNIYDKIEEYSEVLFGESSEKYIEILLESGLKKIELGCAYNSPLFKAKEICKNKIPENKLLLTKVLLALGDYYYLQNPNIEKISHNEGDNEYLDAFFLMRQIMFPKGSIKSMVYKLPMFIRRPLLNKIDNGHPELIPYLRKLGNRDLSKNDFESYVWIENLALKMSLRHYGENHPETMECYKELGKAYFKMGSDKYEKASKCLSAGLKLQRELKGERHPSTGKYMITLGSFYGENKNFEEAISFIEKGLEIIRTNYGVYHKETARANYLLADLYFKIKNYQKALPYALESAKVRNYLLSKYDYDRKESLKLVRDIYEIIGDKKCQAEYEEQIKDATWKIQSHNGDLIDWRDLFGEEFKNLK